jgi:hypothetical protein
MRFRIWSLEHNAWWRPNAAGYAVAISDSGIYSFEQAAEICEEANLYMHTWGKPNAAMVPVVEEGAPS